MLFLGHTSSTVKNRYNKKTYKRFEAQLKPEFYEELNAFCKDNNLSKPEFLKLSLEKLKNSQQ